MKYSRGPWEILRIPDRDYISGELYQILDADGAPIATMNISETFLVQANSRETMRANASLIVTAPNLLECLKKLTKRCKTELSLNAETKALLKEAVIVISQAEGWGDGQ